MEKNENLKKIAIILKALSDENRLRALCIINTCMELCVCALTDIIGLSQPTISIHMKILESCGLVKRKKKKKWVYYCINKGHEDEVREILKNIFILAKKDPKIQKDIDKILKMDFSEMCCSRTVLKKVNCSKIDERSLKCYIR
jgi:ArsR family transcriptional regulator, arsenate/arsenite/antimonite-responsive transcriptional repressor